MTNQVQEFNTHAQQSSLKPQRQDLFSLAPKTLAEAMEYAKLIADSGMVPKQFIGRPADVLVAVQMGAELGLPPTQALQNIAVINGRPSLWGDAVLAIVKASPLCEYVREYWDDNNKTATCIAKRRGDDQEVAATFSFEDAKVAGLWGKAGPWTQYPKRMAKMRARSWAVRDAFPDILRGISVAEESLDKEEKDITPQQQQSAPAQTKTQSLLNRLKNDSVVLVQDNSQDMLFVAVSMVLDQINRAQTEDQLHEAANLARQLPEQDQDSARKAYKNKLDQLRNGTQSDHIDVLPKGEN